MYICTSCKKEFEGTPILSNIAGVFCGKCRGQSIVAMRQTKKSRKLYILNERGCAWLGCELKTEKEKAHGVCRKCAVKVDWLLESIRHTDHAAKYVEYRENKHGAKRDETKRIKEAEKINKIKEKESQDEINVEQKVDKLENLLSVLIEKLGGI